jgi:hypothetical protein
VVASKFLCLPPGPPCRLKGDFATAIPLNRTAREASTALAAAVEKIGELAPAVRLAQTRTGFRATAAADTSRLLTTTAPSNSDRLSFSSGAIANRGLRGGKVVTFMVTLVSCCANAEAIIANGSTIGDQALALALRPLGSAVQIVYAASALEGVDP